VVGDRWHDNDPVFASSVGTSLDSANVRRVFRRIAAAAGFDANRWTPRELRHSFVSIQPDEGVPIERITQLAGHVGGSAVTETRLPQAAPARHRRRGNGDEPHNPRPERYAPSWALSPSATTTDARS
jgi:integrase